MTAHVEMNVVGASETVVPHAVAEGYQRTKRIKKNTQKDMTGKSGGTFIGNGQ